MVRRKPDVLVVLGDWWDFPSLSSHDEKGSAKKENARVVEDLAAGTAALKRLMDPLPTSFDMRSDIVMTYAFFRLTSLPQRSHR